MDQAVVKSKAPRNFSCDRDIDDNWAHCAQVAEGIARGEQWALAQLYERMHGTFRSRIIQLSYSSFLYRHEIDDLLHDIFIKIVCQIQLKPLREPARLMGFVATVIHRSVVLHMTKGKRHWQATEDLGELELEMSRQSAPRNELPQGSATSRHRDTSLRLLIAEEASDPTNPLSILLEREESREVLNSLREAMATLRVHEQEILIRFYLQQQCPRKICREMKITETQYRLLKSRAKAKFGAVGKKLSRRQTRWISDTKTV